jgi:DNA-binding response OmpR family regulator
MRVLLVEDSRRLRLSLEQALKNSGYAVESVEDGKDGFLQAQSRTFDVIVLDIMLPGMDGFQILERLRKSGNDTPVLCLTARGTLEDRLKGLHTGADDYLVKPFELRELLARIHALCRRRYSQYADKMTLGDLELDRSAKRATRKGKEIELQPREFALLEYLMLKPKQVVSRREIEEHIYNDLDAPESNAVDSAICALRRKIASYPGAPQLIHTRRGLGYVVTDAAP